MPDAGLASLELVALNADAATVNLRIEVGGVTVEESPGSYKRSEYLSGKHTCAFKLVDTHPWRYLGIVVGQEVVVWQGTEKIFGGMVDRVEREAPRSDDPGSPRVSFVRVGAVGHESLTDRYLVLDGYTDHDREVSIEWAAGVAMVVDVEHGYESGHIVDVFEGEGDLIGEFEIEVQTPDRYSFVVRDPGVDGAITARLRRYLTLYEVVHQVVYDSTPLHLDGVVLDMAEDFALIVGPRTIDRKSARKVLDGLAQEFDLIWSIDSDKVLTFFSSASKPPAWRYGASYAKSYSRIRVRDSRKDYRNSHYVGAGSAETASIQADTFVADGETRSFECALPLAMKPTIKERASGDPTSFDSIGLTPNASGSYQVHEDLIGLQAVDDADATDDDGEYLFRWFFEEDEAKVSMNSNVEKLAEGVVLQIGSIGLQPIITYADDVLEQARRRAIEGGSGIYETSRNAEDVRTVEAATDLAESDLSRHGVMPRELLIETLDRGHEVGRRVGLDFPGLGIERSDDYVVTSVSEKSLSGTRALRRSISASRLQRPESEFDFWRRLTAEGVREISSNKARSLHILRRASEGVAIDERAASVDQRDALDDSYDDVVTTPRLGYARFGLAKIASVQRTRTMVPISVVTIIGLP